MTVSCNYLPSSMVGSPQLIESCPPGELWAFCKATTEGTTASEARLSSHGGDENAHTLTANQGKKLYEKASNKACNTVPHHSHFMAFHPHSHSKAFHLANNHIILWETPNGILYYNSICPLGHGL